MGFRTTTRTRTSPNAFVGAGCALCSRKAGCLCSTSSSVALWPRLSRPSHEARRGYTADSHLGQQYRRYCFLGRPLTLDPGPSSEPCCWLGAMLQTSNMPSKPSDRLCRHIAGAVWMKLGLVIIVYGALLPSLTTRR